MAPDIRHDGKRNHDHNNAQRRPGGRESVHGGQEPVAKSAGDESADAARVEDQQQLPGGEGEVWVVHGYRAGDEAGEAEVHGERDGPVPDQPDPARDVGEGHFAFAGEFCEGAKRELLVCDRTELNDGQW